MFKVDLTAPRKPRKPAKRLLTKEGFNKYKKSEKYHPYIKDDSLFKTILRAVTDEITTEVTLNPNGVELYNTALLMMTGVPTMTTAKNKNNGYVDIHMSNKVGQKVVFNNFHTDGKMLKIIFSQLPSKFKFARISNWKFVTARTFKRKCSAAFKKNFNKYISKREGETLEDMIRYIYKK